MASANQLYSLTWGDFGTSLISAVQLLRCQGDLVDVTLAAGGRCFSAHKIVLCAASPFLLDLLKSTPCKHPVVMLAGVTAADLEALLEFVYCGEVSIDSSQLPSLLQAAHYLNIQGLSPASNEGNQSNVHNTIKANIHSTIKAVIDMVKSEDVNQQNTSENNESLTRDVINSLLPMRRKKRMKRKGSITMRNKRQDIAENSDNRTLEHQNIGDNNAPNTGTSDVWTTSTDLTFTSVQSTSNQLEPNQLLVNHMPHVTTATTPNNQSKIRSASDQPGACPLCGAMLRQARNLRRHLLTSCKYRGSAESLQMSGNVSQSEHRAMLREPDLHQLQPAVQMANVERVLANSVNQHLENKNSVLSGMPCANIIVADCNSLNASIKQ